MRTLLSPLHIPIIINSLLLEKNPNYQASTVFHCGYSGYEQISSDSKIVNGIDFPNSLKFVYNFKFRNDSAFTFLPNSLS